MRGKILPLFLPSVAVEMARLTSISLAETDFDADAAARTFRTGVEDAGAIVSFWAKSVPKADNPATVMHLDHMPEATLASIEKIADAAEARWPLLKARSSTVSAR